MPLVLNWHFGQIIWFPCLHGIPCTCQQVVLYGFQMGVVLGLGNKCDFAMLLGLQFSSAYLLNSSVIASITCPSLFKQLIPKHRSTVYGRPWSASADYPTGLTTHLYGKGTSTPTGLPIAAPLSTNLLLSNKKEWSGDDELPLHLNSLSFR